MSSTSSLKDELYGKGFFLIGDSAYSIRSFLITPYDLAKNGTPQDDFNFYHSSARITVECAFGEIDLRWGIFWKRLCCSLDNSCLIIEGALRLHNFLVDYREYTTNSMKEDEVIFQHEISDTGAEPMQIGNDNARPSGRPTNPETHMRRNGLLLRNKISDALVDCDMHRPPLKEWCEDHNTHVHRL